LLQDLRRTLTRPPQILPKGYVAYVRHQIRGMFPKGWDSGLYDGFCYTNTPSLSATSDSSRLDGGCFSVVQDQVELLDRSQGRVAYETNGCSGQLLVVQSAGKPRALTKFSSGELVLRPLHRSIYEHLSRRTSWLCRGDPTAAKLKRAGFREGGGVLVSGDYRSATDNLSLEVAEVILETILGNSACVPDSVRSHAMQVLRPLLWNIELDIEFEITRGQMMGSYLSFPLLCLQNFLSFDFARREAGLGKMPLLINGDDILFQSSDSAFPTRWMGFVSGLGLEVERSKTSVSDSFGTLNSTLFEWNEGFLEVVPTLRFGMLRRPEYVVSLGATFHSFLRGQPPDVRWRAGRTFFSWHLGAMKSIRARPDEFGLRGGLAFRLSRIFGLLDGDLAIRQLPRAPVPHNVVLNRNEVTFLDPERLSSELKLLNDRQMASWKFAVDFVGERSSSVIQYCLQVSDLRRPEFYSEARIQHSQLFSWRRVCSLRVNREP
jgi:hypothetical protein